MKIPPTSLTTEQAPSVPPLSEVLHNLRHSLPPAPTVATLVDALHERGTGALMALFSLPVILPVPGVNTLFALPLAFLAARQTAGRDTIWLPRGMMEKRIDRARLDALIVRVLPWLRRLEKILCPRLTIVTAPAATRLVGLLVTVMALFASLPIPLTHTVPGIGLLLIAAGLTQRDGLAVVTGILIGMAYIIVLTTLVALFGAHAADMIHHLFGHA